MNRNQMEIIYETNGLTDYRLITLDDLKKCHGIDVTGTFGYSGLTEENKDTFQRFILKYFNGHGLDSRMIIVPVSINFVEDIDYIAPDPRAKEDEEYKDYVVSVIRKINVIKDNGEIEPLHKYQDKEYRKIKPTTRRKTTYLRFEFKEDKTKVWLHVTHNGTQWY